MSAASDARNAKALEFIESYCRRWTHGPTVREVMEAMGYRSSRTGLTVIRDLEEAGKISRDLTRLRRIQCCKE